MKGKSLKIIISGTFIIIISFIIAVIFQIFSMLKIMGVISADKPVNTDVMTGLMKSMLMTGIVASIVFVIGLFLIAIGILQYFLKEKTESRE